MYRYSSLLMVVLSSSCLVLDSMLPFHSNIHCSEVSADSEHCTKDDYWDRVCTPCDEEYDWERNYQWAENDRAYTVANAEIRPIDNSVVMDVDFSSTDGEATLDAYFISAHGEIPDLAETTVVYNHGRYASIDHYMPRIQMLHEIGVNVYVWDYRGYGKSLPETAPDSRAWMDDASKALDEVKALAPNPERIIFYGMSVGGYPSGEMAIEDLNCALILEAAVLSVSEKIEDNLSILLPGSFLTTGLLEQDLALKETTKPVLVLQGSEDDRVSLRSVKSFYDQLPESTPKRYELISGAGHGLGGVGGVPEADFAAYRDIIHTFLREQAPLCVGSDSTSGE